jgi:hypothetical protein
MQTSSPASSFSLAVILGVFVFGEECGVVVYSEPQFRHRVGVEAGTLRFFEFGESFSGARSVLFLLLLLLLLLLLTLLLPVLLLLDLLLVDLLLLGLLLLNLLVLIAGEKATEGSRGEATIPDDRESSSGCD